MATALSSYLPSTLRSNFEHSNFSYSYSDLPVFQSELNPKKLCSIGENVRPKSDFFKPLAKNECVVGVHKHSNSTENRGLRSLQYNNLAKSVALDRDKKNIHVNSNHNAIVECEYKNIPAEQKTRKNFSPRKYSTTFTRIDQSDERERTFQNKCIDLRPTKSFSKVEGLRKKFEFQSRSFDEKTKDDKFKYENLKFPPKLKNNCDINKEDAKFPSKNSLQTKSSDNESEFIRRLNVFRKSHSADDEKNAKIQNINYAPTFASENPSSFQTGKKYSFPKIISKSVKIKTIDSEKRDISTLDIVTNAKSKLNKIAQPVSNANWTISNSPPHTKEKDGSTSNEENLRKSPDKESDRSSNLASSVLRLRNSIFSSLKLPRRISAKMNSQQQMSGRDTLPGRCYTMGAGSLSSGANAHKRKSAVELLAESKAFYVKSETVLDRKQDIPLRVNSTLCTGTNSGTHYATLSGRHRRGVAGEPLQNQLRRLLGSTSLQSPMTPQESRSQTPRYPDKKGKESFEWDATSHPPLTNRSHYNSGTFSGNSSSGTSGSKGQVKSDPEHSRGSMSACFSSKSLNRPSSSGDNRIFFPDSFVVPKTSRSDPANVFSNSFSIESPFSSPEKIDARQILSVVDAYDNCVYGRSDSKNEYYDERDLLENYSTISPPAEYAVTERSNYRYVRSNSHSHTMKSNQEGSYVINFNSHKSLPDLHKQGENFIENGRRLIGIGGSGHYIPDCEPGTDDRIPLQTQTVRSSEALSCYSKTTSGRSYRSSALSSKGSEGYSRRSASCHNSDLSGHTGRGSADEVYYYNRSGSSYARDSGGSSGHCSGPLGPPSLRGHPPAPTISLQQRRDSGSSTQHSSTRSHRYSSYYNNRYQDPDPNDALEYHVSAPLQFQDGVQFNHGSSSGQLAVNATVSISTNFATRNDGFRTTGTAHIETCQASDRPALVGIHFQASIPPVQFQDAQTPLYGYNGSYSSEGFYGRRESGTRESRHLLTRRPASSGCNQASTCYDEENEGAHSLPHEIDGSPPSLSGLGNFKRQRCLRYKHRPTPRRPILRSKSDISDRYWRGDDKGTLSLIDKSNNTPPSSDNNSPSRVARMKLDKFFDQLGMDDETYNEVILKDLKKPRSKKDRNKIKTSPSHGDSQQDADVSSKCSEDEANDELSSSFASSDISFPDSNLIPNNADYTVQGGTPNDTKPYRSYEPLSIVERNARIIKWLCNCRKLQAV